MNEEQIEPVLEIEEVNKQIEYIYYPGSYENGAPRTPPFDAVEFYESVFYKIEGFWWQLSHVGSDSKGIYMSFYRVKGEFKGWQ